MNPQPTTKQFLFILISSLSLQACGDDAGPKAPFQGTYKRLEASCSDSSETLKAASFRSETDTTILEAEDSKIRFYSIKTKDCSVRSEYEVTKIEGKRVFVKGGQVDSTGSSQACATIKASTERSALKGDKLYADVDVAGDIVKWSLPDSKSCVVWKKTSAAGSGASPAATDKEKEKEKALKYQDLQEALGAGWMGSYEMKGTPESCKMISSRSPGDSRNIPLPSGSNNGDYHSLRVNKIRLAKDWIIVELKCSDYPGKVELNYPVESVDSKVITMRAGSVSGYADNCEQSVEELRRKVPTIKPVTSDWAKSANRFEMTNPLTGQCMVFQK